MKKWKNFSAAKRAALAAFFFLSIWFVGYGFAYPTRLPLASSEGIVFSRILGWITIPRILDLLLGPLLASTVPGCAKRVWTMAGQGHWPMTGKMALNFFPVLACLLALPLGSWAGCVLATFAVAGLLAVIVVASLAYSGTRRRVGPDIWVALRFATSKVVGWIRIALSAIRTAIAEALQGEADEEIREIDLSTREGDASETLTDDLVFDEGREVDLTPDKSYFTEDGQLVLGKNRKFAADGRDEYGLDEDGFDQDGERADRPWLEATKRLRAPLFQVPPHTP